MVLRLGVVAMRFVAAAACIVLAAVNGTAAGTAESVGMHGTALVCLAVTAAFLAGGIVLMWGRE